MGLFLVGVYLLLVALVDLFNVAISNTFMGIVALIAAIVLLVEVGLPYARKV